jgi:2-keto-4-pentenoate hydratase
VTVSEAESEVFAPASIAPQFVEARLKGVSVAGYPGGVLPKSMAEGYAVQDLAIDLWPDELVGWKVGLVPPQHRERLSAERLAGCIFKSKVWDRGRTSPPRSAPSPAASPPWRPSSSSAWARTLRPTRPNGPQRKPPNTWAS